MISLYHATKATADGAAVENAEAIVDNGFTGGNVWDMTNVVFLADKPIAGFGGAWVVVDVDEATLPAGEYAEKFSDDDLYRAQCFAFSPEVINQFPRSILTAAQMESAAEAEYL
jgi:hypothetical protein